MINLRATLELRHLNDKDYLNHYLLNLRRFGFDVHKPGDPPKEGIYFMILPLNDDIIMDLSTTKFSSGVEFGEPILSILSGERLYGDFVQIGEIASDEPTAVLLCYKYPL